MKPSEFYAAADRAADQAAATAAETPESHHEEMERIDRELQAMRDCWAVLTLLSRGERARALLWLLRRHQNTGGLVSAQDLELDARCSE